MSYYPAMDGLGVAKKKRFTRKHLKQQKAAPRETDSVPKMPEPWSTESEPVTRMYFILLHLANHPEFRKGKFHSPEEVQEATAYAQDVSIFMDGVDGLFQTLSHGKTAPSTERLKAAAIQHIEKIPHTEAGIVQAASVAHQVMQKYKVICIGLIKGLSEKQIIDIEHKFPHLAESLREAKGELKENKKRKEEKTTFVQPSFPGFPAPTPLTPAYQPYVDPGPSIQIDPYTQALIDEAQKPHFSFDRPTVWGGGGADVVSGSPLPVQAPQIPEPENLPSMFTPPPEIKYPMAGLGEPPVASLWPVLGGIALLFYVLGEKK